MKDKKKEFKQESYYYDFNKKMSYRTKKLSRFFAKYENKRDGVIRGFDVKSAPVRIVSVIIMVICILMALVALFPVIWLIFASFKDIREFNREASILPSVFDFSRIVDSWNSLNFTKYYLNSLISAVGCTISAVLFNGLMAYGFAVLKPKGHKIIFTLVMWSLLIPSTTCIISVFRNINLVGLNKSFVPLWLAFGANAFWVVLFKEYFENIPREVLEAAKLDGAGVWRILINFMLPLSKPIIMVVIIFAVTASWSDFLLPYLVLNGSGNETVMVKLFAFKDTPVDAVSVLRATLFSIIPPTVIFIFFQKQITDGVAPGAVKG